MSTALTRRQKEVLNIIETMMTENAGVPPTRVELANYIGFRSPNAAEEHLQALARKGAIELLGGRARGIRLKKPDIPVAQEMLPFPGFNQMLLPLIGRVAAGSPILAQEHVQQQYTVAPELFAEKPDYLLKVRGMSMRDVGILDGDLLAVRATKEAKNGQIVVARLGDDVTVKRFQRNRHLIELHAENPDFKTIVVEPGQPFEIEGLAVGLIRKGIFA